MLEQGFIQAGGRSSRMGRDKAWLPLEGRPLIERVMAAAQPVVNNLNLVINAANQRSAGYQQLAEAHGARLLFDRHEHRGPLGGIHTALAQCQPGESALILACDLPFITTDFLALLGAIHQSTDPPSSVTVPLDQANRPQPLAAIYAHSCLTAIEQMLAADELKVDRLYALVPVRRVGFEEFAHLPKAERFFTNLNTPEEYRAALKP